MFRERPYLTALPLRASATSRKPHRADDCTVQVDDSCTPPAARIGSEVIGAHLERELEIRELTTWRAARHPLAYKKGEVLLPDADRIFNPRARHDRSAPSREHRPNAQACASGCSINAAARQESMWASCAGAALPADRRAGRHGAIAREISFLQGCPASGRAVACAGARAPRDRYRAAATQQHELIASPPNTRVLPTAQRCVHS